MWRKLPNFQVEKEAQNPVTSQAVMVFSVPTKATSLYRNNVGQRAKKSVIDIVSRLLR